MTAVVAKNCTNFNIFDKKSKFCKQILKNSCTKTQILTSLSFENFVCKKGKKCWKGSELILEKKYFAVLFTD